MTASVGVCSGRGLTSKTATDRGRHSFGSRHTRELAQPHATRVRGRRRLRPPTRARVLPTPAVPVRVIRRDASSIPREALEVTFSTHERRHFKRQVPGVRVAAIGTGRR